MGCGLGTHEDGGSALVRLDLSRLDWPTRACGTIFLQPPAPPSFPRRSGTAPGCRTPSTPMEHPNRDRATRRVTTTTSPTALPVARGGKLLQVLGISFGVAV